MNRVRASLVRLYGGQPAHVVEAAHPSTAARCNLNKCSAKALAKVRAIYEKWKLSNACPFLVPLRPNPHQILAPHRWAFPLSALILTR